MSQYKTPGIYREEVFPVLAGALPTGVPIFLGFAREDAPEAVLVNQPKQLTLWTEFVTHFGKALPNSYLAYAVRGFFENGGSADVDGVHAHSPPHPVPGEPVTSREVVFIHPFDGDSDGWPDLGTSGEPEWGSTEISFVLRPTGDGTNNLERRVNGASPRTLAKNVTRFLVEDSEATGYQIPFNSLRVRLTLAIKDLTGSVYRRTLEEVIQLRNGRRL